jgi:hypothetical protein
MDLSVGLEFSPEGGTSCARACNKACPVLGLMQTSTSAIVKHLKASLMCFSYDDSLRVRTRPENRFTVDHPTTLQTMSWLDLLWLLRSNPS